MYLDSMNRYRLEDPIKSFNWALEAEMQYKTLKLERPRELARILNVQASAYYSANNWEKVRTYAEQTLTLQPASFERMYAFNLLGEYHKEMIRLDSSQARSFQAALNNYDLALLNIPQDLPTDSSAYYRVAFLNNKAECYLLAGNLAAAKNMLDSAYQAFNNIHPGVLKADRSNNFRKLVRRMEGYLYWNQARIQISQQNFVVADQWLLRCLEVRWQQREDFKEEWREAEKLMDESISASVWEGPEYFKAASVSLVNLFCDQITQGDTTRKKFCEAKNRLINEVRANYDNFKSQEKNRESTLRFSNNILWSFVIILIGSLLAVLLNSYRKKWQWLKENERLLFAVRNATPAISIFDNEDRLRFFNNSFQKHLDLPEANLFGRRFQDISHPETVSAVDIKKKIEQQKGESFQYDSKLGSSYVRTEAIMFPDHSPLNGWWVAVDTDVTDLRNIAWIIGHEMKGYLRSTAQLAAQIAERLPPDQNDPLIRDAFRHLITSVENAHIEFEGLDRLAKFQLNEEKFNPKACNLHTVLTGALEKVQYWVEYNHIAISNETDPSCWVSADEEMLYLVFRNLLNNSINASIQMKKAPGEPGQIRISTQSVDGGACVSIEDNGTGIEENLASILFSGKKRKGGLGTQLCAHFIERHKGTIKVEHSEPGRTVISFTLLTAKQPEP
ncbi:MAG: GHKL domain-containing protein [Saprospirales bacterium]|nr:GHKL domain-containing protein [Saprospirales bacterium]